MALVNNTNLHPFSLKLDEHETWKLRFLERHVNEGWVFVRRRTNLKQSYKLEYSLNSAWQSLSTIFSRIEDCVICVILI